MAQADRTGKGVAEARDVRAAVKGAMAEAKAPKPSTSREECAAAVLADARGERVDWEGIARRRLGEIMASGEDKDVVNAARAFLPPRKARDEAPDDEGAPDPGEARAAEVAALERAVALATDPAQRALLEELLFRKDPLRPVPASMRRGGG